MIYIEDKCKKELSDWKKDNVTMYKKIQKLILAICTNPFEGIGKPEPLKHQLAGLWSRRIDRKNRIIYQVKEQDIWIFSCKGHYNNN